MKRLIYGTMVLAFILMGCFNGEQFKDVAKVVEGDSTAPEINLSVPGFENELSGTVTIGVTATDESEIISIVIQLNGSIIATLSGSETEYVLDTTLFENGTYALVIVVTDGAGNSAEDSIQIQIANPTTGTISGVINGNASVTLEQSDGTVQTTQTSFADPEYIFENVAEGEATLVFEAGGTTTTQTVQVNPGVTTEVNTFGSTQEMLNSLKVTVHDQTVKNSSAKVENLSEEALGEAFYTREINVPTRSFSEGFPGVTDKFEWFGLIYEGKITAPADGEYTFWVTCDDGGALYVDGNMVVNGNYVHAPQTFSGKVTLTQGQKYDFMVKYFQGPRYYIALVVEVQMPGGQRQLFNMADFK